VGKGKPRSNRGQAVGAPRTPKALPLRNGHDRLPLFSFEYADRGGPWPFTPEADHAATLLSFISEMGRLSWKEIEAQMTSNRRATHRKHHGHQLDQLSSGVQNRLTTLGLDEVTDELFRFRLGGKQRLWGFVADHTFHILWWDPEHDVYPTEP
jgi:hypothetical protein